MFFWRNRETTKSEKIAPPGWQSLTKAYRPVMASVKKWLQKWGKSKVVSWKIPPNEGFKGKIINLNGGFSRPCLPKGQSFFFAVLSRIKYGIWCCQEIHSSHVPGLENCSSDIDLRFPWIFPISWWGHKRRAGDFVWNSEKDDLKFRHLFVTVETSWTSWKIFVYLRCFFPVCPTFIAVVAGSHAAQPWDPSEYVGQTLQVRSW